MVHTFCVRAWRGWAGDPETLSTWQQWDRQTEGPGETTAGPVPVLLRRRVSPLGQKALQAAWALPGSATARAIFTSRHGEFGRTVSILDSLIAGTDVSPADFTLSVHNALAGLLSIARANRQGHTTIAAGAESFPFGMLEAIACLAERPDDPVLLVHFDEKLPPPFDTFDSGTPEAIAVALVLAASGGTPVRLRTEPAQSPSSADCPVRAFLRVLLGADEEASYVGEQLAWHWRRGDAPG